MAGQIQVNYASMDAGTAALGSFTQGLRDQLETLMAASVKVRTTWDGPSQVAFQETHDRIAKQCDKVDMIQTSHGKLLQEMSQATAQTDATYAGRFA